MWREIRAAETSLRRPLACAWHVNGIAIAEFPPELKKRIETYKYCDGSPMFQHKIEPKRKLPIHPGFIEARNTAPPQPRPRVSCTERELNLGDVNAANYVDQVALKIFENGGALVTGPGGVGKTT